MQFKLQTKVKRYHSEKSSNLRLSRWILPPLGYGCFHPSPDLLIGDRAWYCRRCERHIRDGELLLAVANVPTSRIEENTAILIIVCKRHTALHLMNTTCRY
jgi:hypothetical protein